jgi:hypothetical protein
MPKETPPTTLTSEPLETEKELTKAEIEEQTRAIIEGLGQTYDPAPKEEKKEATKDKAEPKTEPKVDEKKADSSAAEEAPKKEPVKSKAKPAPKQPAVTAEDVATKVVQKLAAEKPVEPVKETAKVEPATDELPPHRRRYREALAVLAENSEYKDAPAKFDEFVAAEKKYKADWQKENKYKRFNESDDEHDAFYKENEPVFDTEDLEAAKETVILRKAEKHTEELISRKDAERRHQQTVAQAGERVKVVQSESEANVIHDLDPEYKDVNTLADLTAKDPLAGVILEPLANDLKVLTSELELLFTPGLGYQVDAGKPAHALLMNRIKEYESFLSKKPAEELEKDGKAFATNARYANMSDAQKADHWTIFGEKDYIKAALVADYVGLARRKLAQVRPKNGTASNSKAEKLAPETEKEPSNVVPMKDAQPAPEKQFPTLSSSSDRVPTEGMGATHSKNDADLIIAGLMN